ncbi:cell division protein [Leifsonia xyli subsp. xyli]|uniref:Cell wall synthesis protein Wag31 n=2 Tax=Leifsonia xyli subsp. xyli TaxID=59736 RepID=Q6AE71_LEIXX|nr:DivIVA domain-containing protein [Leifsonia xyli]AAT89325.1 cell division initiation protein [Leifsonia xyli subsp. xyli str. CTCB07]ODA89653.1 cell division protein [Leifsonia xyli subsp. xyli]
MALTPEDVVNKRFQPTKFREGYDQDEVDDFLDEVVVELRRLTQENEELKQRLVASDSRIAELQRTVGVSGPVAASLGASDGEILRLQRENEELQQRLAIAQRETAEARQQAAAAPSAGAPLAAAGFAVGAATDANDPNATNNLLQLARRLHEEHVREGVEKRDALIAEGHATAARIVAEAESKQRAQIASLDQERVGLERRIEELRGFERDYRSGLKSYIENQLRDLDSQQVGGSGSSNRASGVPAPVPASHGDLSNGSDQGAQPPVFPGFGG